MKLPYHRWVQSVCPSPRRHVQRIILNEGLKTGLDIGCGDFSCLTALRAFGFRSTGVDAWAETIEACRKRNVHDAYLVGNFLEMEFPEEFDVVVLSHVIEHLDRDTGWLALRKLERIAKRLVYVETPRGFLEQPAMRGNPWQRHLSGWFPHDFESRGYNVYGAGPGFLFGPMGRSRCLPSPVARQLSRLLQFYYFRHPSSAHSIAAIRYVDAEGNLRNV
jgi:SAM-dependent methyltransferase